MKSPLPFTGNPLDRASEKRPDTAWLAAQRLAGRVLPFWQSKPLLLDNQAGFLPWRADWDGLLPIFLGLDGTEALFAVDLPGAAEPALGGRFEEMRAAAFILPVADTAICGQAKALLDWHRRHGFCPNCGAATAPKDGGWRRACPACGAEHFPRTDPVAIMLPLFEDHCLVGRNARFPAGGLYSAFAGFIEPGETVEDGVRRELREEAGITVGAVTYHASQHWPFPSSLMLGCYAQAQSHDFAIDGVEIIDARWLSKAEARARLEQPQEDFKLPTSIAIAHQLIRDWVEAD